MPRSRKRKRESDDYRDLKCKLRKLEKKVKRASRKRRYSSSSRESDSYSRSSERSARSRTPERSPRERYSSADRRSPSPVVISESEGQQNNEGKQTSQNALPVEPATNSGANSCAGPETSGAAADASAADDPDPAPTLASTVTVVAPPLDLSILEMFGEDPTLCTKYDSEIQSDLAIRIEHTVTKGLSKETRKELKEKHFIPANCKLIDAPALNPEMKAAISEAVLKRDKSIELKQKQVAVAIGCLCKAINRACLAKDKDEDLVKLLIDAQRLMCDSQYNDSVTRRNFILSSVKKDMKEQLENTTPDSLLFGQNLAETLKTAKAISKSGAELKVAAPKPQTSKRPAPTPSKSLNSKAPYPSRRQAGTQRTKEPASTKNQHASSSKQSQRRPPQSYRR